MKTKITVYKDNAKLVGYVVKISDINNKVVVVRIDGKEYVGRLVNSNVEI